MLELVWALVLPAFRGPDEIEHMKRASAIAQGDLVPQSHDGPAKGDLVRVERDFAEALHDRCAELHADFDPESCEPVTAGGSTDEAVSMASISARYNPAWYVLVAPASWFFEGAGTLWAARGISGLASAAVLAWALWLRRRSGGSLWQHAATMLCLTPAVTFAGSVAAPNGLHYASGLLLWSALLADTDRVSPRSRVRAVAVGGTVLVLTHTLGAVWLVCAAVVFAVARGRAGVVGLLRGFRAAPWHAALLVTAGAFAAAWILTLRTNDPGLGEPLADVTKQMPALAHGVVWMFQLVGTMPFRFGLLWPIVYALWVLAYAVLAWAALRGAPVRPRPVLACLTAVAMGVAVPVAATVVTYDALGYAWQGRYELPLLFAVPLLAAEAVVNRSASRLPELLVLVTGVATAVAALCLGLREDRQVVATTLAVVLALVGWAVVWWAQSHAQDDRPGQEEDEAAIQRSSAA